jgi:diguanylate cyclase (GGDEF)-like protein
VRNTPTFLALAAAPTAALSLVTYLSWGGASSDLLGAALVALGGASAVIALVFALDAARMRRAFAHLRGGGSALGYEPPERQLRRDRRQHETVARLRRQVEQLSTIRDLALIANDDVQLERVLERALTALGGLLDARELAIFLVEGADQDELVAVGHLRGEKIRVRGERPLTGVTAREAYRALEARQSTVDTTSGGLRAATLLVADGEIMGAIEVRLAPGACAPDPRELTWELEALAKPIALAIRKPTLYDRAVVDGLTRLYTKRHFLEQVQPHMAQRQRLGTPLSLIILDVDHFKQVNDVHGHVAGDRVLAEVARRVKGQIRAYDQAFRYGGEEVVILLPNTALSAAVGLAGRLRAKIRNKPFDTGEDQLEVRASFGVAEFEPDSMDSVSAFVDHADQHLYRAKHNGRDQVQSLLTVEASAAAA